MQLQLMLACLATALMGGIFFAFSSFIMTALGRIPASEGIRAMQRINIDVFTWSFEWTFFGTPALCLALLVQALLGFADERAPWTIAGAVIYLLGCLLVTGLGPVGLAAAQLVGWSARRLAVAGAVTLSGRAAPRGSERAAVGCALAGHARTSRAGGIATDLTGPVFRTGH